VEINEVPRESWSDIADSDIDELSEIESSSLSFDCRITISDRILILTEPEEDSSEHSWSLSLSAEEEKSVSESECASMRPAEFASSAKGYYEEHYAFGFNEYFTTQERVDENRESDDLNLIYLLQ
jgi:hypothetical protein